jgi:hypothetical protein
MLAEQEYDGHVSIHDDKMAEDLGFSGAPIEGPTHFSQFVPILHEIFGNAWFETGCISAHYQNMVIEGDEVRAYARRPEEGATTTHIWAEKRDGTPVLMGTASIGPDYGETEVDRRIARMQPSDQLVILSELKVGQQGAGNPEQVIMDFDQHLGNQYPFSLNEKLKVITEPSPWYTREEGAKSPWGRAIIPLEMISCLTEYSVGLGGFHSRGPAVGLYAGQEIKLIKGPLFVNHPYELNREIVCLSESRRTESNWVKTRVLDGETQELVAEVTLNHATLKDSYARYEEDAKALGKVL